MTTTTIAPYGAWRSPISANDVAASSLSLHLLQIDGDDVYWIEGRPLEQGRYVIVRYGADGRCQDVTPPDFNARTLVHEYGGGSYVVHRQTVYFVNYSDQRLYRQMPGAAPQPISEEPMQPRSVRYADLRVTPDGRFLLCVRERHQGARPADVINDLVAIALDGSGEVRVLASGYDFYSTPRISPDGRQLAWLCWNFPQMPWDGTELWTAEWDETGAVRKAQRLAGGSQESIFQPEWSPVGVLYFISDRSNWWNLYRLVDGVVEAVAPTETDIGGPQWVFDLSVYAFLASGAIVCAYKQQGHDQLGLIEAGERQITPIASEYWDFDYVRSNGVNLYAIASCTTDSDAAVRLHLSSRQGTVQSTVLKRATDYNLDRAYLSVPQAIEFPTEDGLTAHAFYYAPTNPAYAGPPAERPPLLALSHGGPTGATSAALSLKIQYWTSRGFAVVDVNYGGSTGYGRAYRQRLNGMWGVVDVMDCINAARYLVEAGKADGKRLVIRGGSAGGYTTLRALTWQTFFTTGAAYYPVADLEPFVYDTHKFEARYLDSLIGPYPERKDLYLDRSPVNFVENLNVPLILFQGLEDKVVPPAQPEAMVAVLQRKGLPYAYLTFAGEQHGFRKAETIVRCAEAELYFYGKLFGFEPADAIEPVEIFNLK
jgi:dipeptidyl aminopeptidase/acylaminoacyl peptidase